MRSIALYFLCVTLTLSIPSFLTTQGALTAQEPDQTPIDSDKIREHVAFLASDLLEGRDSGEPGLEVAAEYIARKLADYGVQPAGDYGSYFQYFSVPQGARFAAQDRVDIKVAGVELHWNAGAEVEAFGYADPRTDSATRVSAPVVFAGYGIRAEPEDEGNGFNYDDYAGLEVGGKIVALLRYAPRYHGGRGEFPGGPRRANHHAAFATKLRKAAELGAVGILLITHSEKDIPYGIAHRAAPRQPTLPAFVARRSAVKKLFSLAGKDLDRLAREIDEQLQPRSTDLGDTNLSFETTRRNIRLRNVVGKIEGSDPALAHESIVIGGHYDHIGRWGNQVSEKYLGQVHNGADDNASGTAGMLELGRVFASGKRPRRSIILLAFSGEEIGLLGSRAWVNARRTFRVREELAFLEHPHASPTDSATEAPGRILMATGEGRGSLIEVLRVGGDKGWVDSRKLEQVSGPEPLQNIVTMINLDMIGRSKASGEVTIMGTNSSPGFKDLVMKLSETSGVPVRPRDGGPGGSDHMNFLQKNIPVLFFNTNLTSTYNKPSDDLETLNIEGETGICLLIRDIVQTLGDADERPEFNPHSGGRQRIVLGVQIDPRYRGKGVRVASVMPDSVAQKAGLKPGDVIVDLGPSSIADFESLRSALQNHADGETKVNVLRDEKTVALSAEFPKKSSGGFGVTFGSRPDYAFAEKGVRFEDITKDSPAARGGVKPGDVLLRWKGKEIDDVAHWTSFLREHKPGDKISIVVKRNDKLIELEITLTAR